MGSLIHRLPNEPTKIRMLKSSSSWLTTCCNFLWKSAERVNELFPNTSADKSALNKLILEKIEGDSRFDGSFNMVIPAVLGRLIVGGTSPFCSRISWELCEMRRFASRNFASKGLIERHFWMISAVDGTSKIKN